MTDNEKITTVKTLLDQDANATDGTVQVYLNLAKYQILNRLYSFGIPQGTTNVPQRYELLQCEIARNLFLKRGAEGEAVHNENGVSRTYEGLDVLLSQITPIAKV